MAENLGASFSIDIGNLKAGLSEANRLIRHSNSEFLSAAAGMDDWQSSAEGLEAKNKNLNDVIDLQSKKVKALVKEKEQVISTMKQEGASNDDIARAVDGLNKQIEKESKALIKSKGELSKNEKALNDLRSSTDSAGNAANTASVDIDELSDSFDHQSDSADDASDSTDKAKNSLKNIKSIGGAVGGVLKAIAGAAAGVVTSFFALAESTREFRTQMAKVETAFTSANKTAEQAQATYDGLYAVLGDSDRSVEASGNLAQLAKSQQDLTNWTTIATGVYATFGDGLPIESLTEAANETAKVGTVTGTLADALNWSSASAQQWSAALSGNAKAQAAFNKGIKEGMSVEDAFNEALLACNNEQERGQIITSALTSVYSDAAGKYKETAANIIAANEAQNNLNKAMAGLGETAEPIMTTVKNLGAEILNSLSPSVSLIGEGLTGAFNGAEGSADKLGQGVSGVITSLLTTITGMLPTITSMLSTLIPSLLDSIISELPAVIDSGVDILLALVNGILSAIPQLVSVIPTIFLNLVDSLTQNGPAIFQAGIDMLNSLTEGLISNLPSLIDSALTAIDSFADMLTENLPLLIEAGIQLIMALVQGLVAALPDLIEKVPEIISKFANLINDNIPTVLQAGIQILITLVKGLIQAIPTLVQNIPKIIQAFLDVWEAFNWIQLGTKAITFLKDGILKMVSSVKNAGKSVMTSATDAIKNLPSKLLEFGKNAVSNLGNAIKNGVSSVKNAATNIFNSIWNALKNLPTKVLSIGKDLVKGIWNGISDMTGWIINKVKGFGDSILGGLKDFFGIHSPSKLMSDQVGKNLALGIGKGFTDEIGSVNKTLVKSMGGLIPSINGSVGVQGAGSAGSSVVVNQYNTYSQAHSRYELFKSKQQTAAAVRLAMAGGVKV